MPGLIRSSRALTLPPWPPDGDLGLLHAAHDPLPPDRLQASADITPQRLGHQARRTADSRGTGHRSRNRLVQPRQQAIQRIGRQCRRLDLFQQRAADRLEARHRIPAFGTKRQMGGEHKTGRLIGGAGGVVEQQFVRSGDGLEASSECPSTSRQFAPQPRHGEAEPRFDGTERQSALLGDHGMRLILEINETQKFRLFGRKLQNGIPQSARSPAPSRSTGRRRGPDPEPVPGRRDRTRAGGPAGWRRFACCARW